MKDSYKKEMSEIHASRKLIGRTREAVQTKEKEINQKNSTKENIFNSRRIYRYIPLFAAALLVVIIIPLYLQSGKTENMDLQLGNQSSVGIQEITDSQETIDSKEIIDNKEVIDNKEIREAVESGFLEECEIMPAEFEAAEEVKASGCSYRILQNEKTGLWEAYLEITGEDSRAESYIAHSTTAEKEEFMTELQDILDAIGR